MNEPSADGLARGPSSRYCLHATLHQQLKPLAPGLTPRSVLDKFAAVQMIDVEIPTTDGRTITLTRYTEPEADLKLLLERLRLELPTLLTTTRNRVILAVGAFVPHFDSPLS